MTTPLSLIPLSQEPFTLFTEWLNEAKKTEIHDANAMSVATATKDGFPSVRILLLKAFDERGFVFYTNNHSRKGQELLENPKASLLFHWKSLKRQVRIEGTVEQVTDEEADRYFASRSYLSRLGAIASQQSAPLQERAIFEKKLKELQEHYKENDIIPRPAHWHGHRLIPQKIEFWQERPYRLHDRAIWVTERADNHAPYHWKVTRLYP